MSSSMRSAAIGIAVVAFGCSKQDSAPAPPAASSAAPVPVVSATASASASAAPEPPHDCPPNSSGPGSFTKPCEAKGTERMMDVKWTKNGAAGPSFAITSRATKLVILYGRIAVYFYDKAGKQIELKDEAGKARPFHTCSGNFFGGPMNPKEKAVLTFSCVPKTVVPEGTATIEAEMSMVGFADAAGKKVDFFWRNPDLAPAARAKGAK